MASNKPCSNCDDDYPEKSGILMGRDELWEKGWHTHKRPGFTGHTVYKDDSPLVEQIKDIGRFPWEEGYEQLWDENGHSLK